MEKTLAQKMEAEISGKIDEAFSSVIRGKNEYYSLHPDKIPELRSIGSLIGNTALANSAISGGASLIPGPWGMLAVVPEIVLVIRNQIDLIYDIAAAHGKKEMMTKELAAMVFISGMGSGAGGLIVSHGSKYLVKRASLQVFQKMITLLGGKITQQALKSAVSKWLPGVGAVAMAAWSNYLTRQIGKKAHEIFSSDVEFTDSLADIELIAPVVAEPNNNEESSAKSNEFFKIKILTNLMSIDGKIEDSELEFVSAMIEGAQISSLDKIDLTSNMLSGNRAVEGIEAIARSPDDSISLLSDLTALAKADGKFHITEKLYIKQIGKLLNFSESDIEEVFNS
ncbi:MAG: TerB family tellurite resistance protein [Rubrivivax sp.]|nr:MAG: TerB family tellurite resistance protein [Rubrivivax sp.]